MPRSVHVARTNDPQLEAAFAKRGSLARWLHFVGGGEFAQLSPLLQGMTISDLMRIPTSGLAKLGMVPATARRLADELTRLKAILSGGIRAPPWLMPLLDPGRVARQRELDANPLTLGPPPKPPPVPVQPRQPPERRPHSARPTTFGRFGRGASGLGRSAGGAATARGASTARPATAPMSRATRPATARTTMQRPRPGAPASAASPRWASSLPPSMRSAKARGGGDGELPPVGGMEARPPAGTRPQSARPAPRGGLLSSRPLVRPSSAWDNSTATHAPPFRGRSLLRPAARAPMGEGAPRPARAQSASPRVSSSRTPSPRAAQRRPLSGRAAVRPPWRDVTSHDGYGESGTARGGGSPRGAAAGMLTGREDGALQGVLGVGGGIVGVGGAAVGVGAAGGAAGARPRGRSASPRGARSSFGRPPDGALALKGTPAGERPVGLLGSVLRREAAIAAMKTAVQREPPPAGRDRVRLLRELSSTLHELREATLDTIELLDARPAGAPRFYWNGMDLALKLLTDLQWAPVPQLLDPLLWKWFGHWCAVWVLPTAACSSGHPQVKPAPFQVCARARNRRRPRPPLASGVPLR